jgi:hypothetical protein
MPSGWWVSPSTDPSGPSRRYGLAAVTRRTGVSVLLALMGVAAIWFGTQTLDQDHASDPSGKEFVAGWISTELWMNLWIVGLGLLLLVAALVFYVAYPRLSGAESHPASRPALTIVGALLGGAIGTLIGAWVIAWVDPGPPDLSMPMMIAMATLGGLGWVIGGTFGWIACRGRPAPSRTAVFLLIAIAIGFVLVGLLAVDQARFGTYWPMIDHLPLHDPLRDRLAFTIIVDTLLTTASALALAAIGFRTRRRST